VIKIVEYLTDSGTSPFSRWFGQLNPRAAARIATAIIRMESGNFSNVKGVGAGVFEYRVHFGPGYRIYFGKDSDVLAVLLGGSTKKGQSKAIRQAQDRWREYKRRRRSGEY
jgi:putative addiction module killer protein